MNTVIKHPRSDQARSRQLRRLESEINIDRARATVSLGLAICKLDELSKHCGGIEELCTMSVECRGILHELENLDSTSASDEVLNLLKRIEQKLIQGARNLDKYRTGASALPLGAATHPATTEGL